MSRNVHPYHDRMDVPAPSGDNIKGLMTWAYVWGSFVLWGFGQRGSCQLLISDHCETTEISLYAEAFLNFSPQLYKRCIKLCGLRLYSAVDDKYLVLRRSDMDHTV